MTENLPQNRPLAAEISTAREAVKNPISKQEVVDWLREAVNMAKLAVEPASMVAAAREAAKIGGFYAKEDKNPIPEGARALAKIIQDMTDEQLYAIRGGHAVIEGECKRVDTPAGGDKAVPEVPADQADKPLSDVQ